ncbi:MAG: response regulator [Magnetospiraceae bacterium]
MSSLRGRFIILLTLIASFVAAFILLYWGPASEEQSRARLIQATESQMRVVSESILTNVLQRQYADLIESLDSILQKEKSWVGISVHDRHGRRIYPLFDPSNPDAGKRVDRLEHVIEFRGAPFARLTVFLDIEADLQRLHSENLFLTVTLVGVMVLGMGMLAGMLSVMVDEPVTALVRAAEKLAKGDYTGQLPTKGPTEILRLYSSFREMRDAIHDNEQALIEKEAQVRELSYAVEQGPVAIVLTDTNGRIIYVNTRFEMDTGYTKSEILGQNPRVLSAGQTDGAVYRDMWAALEQGREWKGEFVNRRKNGTQYHVAASISALRDEDGNVIRYLGFENDITARKAAEMQLQRAKEEAEAARAEAEFASKAKSEFLATMSHEIRTPMNGVIGVTGLILDTELTTEQRHFAETIRASGEALLTIINDILDFSKLEADRLELEQSDFNLNQLIEETMSILATQAHQKGLEVSALTAPETQGLFRGDPGRLRQILVNLVGNAIKFTANGGVMLETSLVREADARKQIRFAITDTGIGIPEKDVDRLFESFTQLDASTSRRYGGSGLGLAICRRLVEAMGGGIGVDSEFGVGSTFWFEIPLPVVVAADQRDLQEKTKKLAHAKILVVDDNAVSRDVLRRILKSWDISAAAVDSGQKALEIIRKSQRSGKPVEAVVLDYHMPDMTGGEVIKQLRADPETADTLIIMASSEPESEYRKAFPNHLPQTFLLKPVRPSLLLDALLAQLIPGNEQPKSTLPTAPQSSAEAGTRLRILVVEDNTINQMVARGILENLGHFVDMAANGREAVEAVTALPYDLVFMDIQMPEMDGYAATKAIRSSGGDHATIPIVAMTANATKEDEEACLAAGMTGYVSKPIDKTRVAKTIRTVVD